MRWHIYSEIDIQTIYIIMAKYSEKASDKIGKVVKEMKAGKLKSSSGEKVTSRKQAIAIGISEAREEGYKVPKKRAATKKAASKPARP